MSEKEYKLAKVLGFLVIGFGTWGFWIVLESIFEDQIKSSMSDAVIWIVLVLSLSNHYFRWLDRIEYLTNKGEQYGENK